MVEKKYLSCLKVNLVKFLAKKIIDEKSKRH